ncbi:MAG: TIGR02466 family protein [Pseudomonadota bacterium]
MAGATSDAHRERDGAGGPPVFREAYFSTFIFYSDIDDAEALNRTLLSAIRAERAKDEVGVVRSNVPTLGGWHSHDQLHSDPDFAPLTDRIHTFSAEIARSLDYDPAWPLTIDNMWAIVNPPGSHNVSHIHPNSLWSGVYYVQAPSKAGKIQFTDPRTQHVMQTPRLDPAATPNSDSWIDVFYEPTPGRMLLFPSWLYHSVGPNLSEEKGEAGERVVISFNMFQKKS